MEEKKNVGQATASLVLGILSLIPFGVLTAIPAVICGHVAKSKIKKNPESLRGEGKALAGLIMGYIAIGLSVFIIPILAAIAIPLMAGNMGRAIATEGQAGCATIATALRIHWVQHENFSGIDDPLDLEMLEPGDLDSAYFDDSSYTFTSLTDVSNYTVTATSHGGGDSVDIKVTMTVSNGNTLWNIDSNQL